MLLLFTNCTSSYYPSYVSTCNVCVRAPSTKPMCVCVCTFFRLAIMNFESDLSIYFGVCCRCCRRRSRWIFSASNSPPFPFFSLTAAVILWAYCFWTIVICRRIHAVSITNNVHNIQRIHVIRRIFTLRVVTHLKSLKSETKNYSCYL